MTFPLPSELQLCGYKIPIILKSDLSVMSEARGMYDTGKNIIYLDTNVSEQQQRSVLIHEYIEALNDVLHMGLSEQQICCLEQGVYQLITQLHS